jgi:hypothetical protein
MMASITKSQHTLVYLLIKAAIVSVVVLLLASCTMNNWGEKLSYKKGELYFTKKVTKEEAQKLADYLQGVGFFNDDKRTSAQLDKSGTDTFLCRFVVIDSFLNKPEMYAYWSAQAASMSKNVFADKPVLVHFCDAYFETKKVVQPAQPSEAANAAE